MEPAVALNLRSLRFHSPRLCRVAVFLIQTTVSLLEHQATARPARPRGPQAPPFFVSKCSYPRLLQPRAWSHLPLPTWMCWTSTGLIGCCPRLAAHLLLGVRHDLKMRELQHQDDLKDPAGRLRRLADLDHHLKRAIPAPPPRREPLSTRMPVSSSGIAVRRRAANAGKNASRRASWQ